MVLQASSPQEDSSDNIEWIMLTQFICPRAHMHMNILCVHEQVLIQKSISDSQMTQAQPLSLRCTPNTRCMNLPVWLSLWRGGSGRWVCRELWCPSLRWAGWSGGQVWNPQNWGWSEGFWKWCGTAWGPSPMWSSVCWTYCLLHLHTHRADINLKIKGDITQGLICLSLYHCPHRCPAAYSLSGSYGPSQASWPRSRLRRRHDACCGSSPVSGCATRSSWRPNSPGWGWGGGEVLHRVTTGWGDPPGCLCVVVEEGVQGGQSSVGCTGPPGGLLANSVELTWETEKDVMRMRKTCSTYIIFKISLPLLVQLCVSTNTYQM